MIEQPLPVTTGGMPETHPMTILWNRGDVWRIFGLFFAFFIVTNIIGGVYSVLAGEIGVGFTAFNTLMMTLTLAGSMLIVNRFRPKHTRFELGFKPVSRKWLGISAVLGGLLVLRSFLLEPLLEAYPALNAGLDVLMEMLSFDSAWETVIVAILVSFIVPFYEELFFRGYVQNAMAGRWGRWVGIIGSGLAFGLFHLIPLQAIAATTLGIVAAWLYDRTGSLWPAIVLHMVNNFVAAAILPLFM